MDIRTLLDSLKRQIMGDQQARKLPLRDTDQSNGQPDEFVRQEYVGPPLVIGNELLITVGIVALYPGLSNSLGRVVIVDRVHVNAEKSIKASAFGIQVDVDLDVAQQMRQAYLSREQT